MLCVLFLSIHTLFIVPKQNILYKHGHSLNSLIIRKERKNQLFLKQFSIYLFFLLLMLFCCWYKCWFVHSIQALPIQYIVFCLSVYGIRSKRVVVTTCKMLCMWVYIQTIKDIFFYCGIYNLYNIWCIYFFLCFVVFIWFFFCSCYSK